MTTEQANLLRTDIIDRLQRSEKESYKDIGRNREGYAQLVEYVLPHMPRSLGEYFITNYVSFLMRNTLRVDFHPRDEEEYPAEIVLGTLRKVEGGLIVGGWVITSGLTPEAYGNTLIIRLEATMKVTDVGPTFAERVMDRVMGRKTLEPKPHPLYLQLAFERLKNTEHCQLMEKEVLVPTIEEHYETKKVLVCDGEEQSS
ncbi:hypothetical protein LCGC14_1056060 [marine sediment metagenome]|uniref:Uncharacterized protein n=1 Tax=marine sediment metagenome TaxID=412755 RepID=A0A0F9QTF1_9ZZZZ